MRTECRLFFCLAILFLISGCSIPTKTYQLRAPYQNNEMLMAYKFVPLQEDAVYSMMEPTEELILWLIQEKGIKTFISLKGDISASRLTIIKELGANLIPFSWTMSRIPPQSEIEDVIKIMNDSKRRPVVIFCRAGTDRTGFIRAYYRITIQGWPVSEALREFYGFGHLPNILDKYIKEKFKNNK